MVLQITSDMSYEVKASKIIQKDKDRISEASKKMKGVLYPIEGDVRFLFEMYHEHIVYYPVETHINCNDCRVMVRNFWQRIVEESTIWN